MIMMSCDSFRQLETDLRRIALRKPVTDMSNQKIVLTPFGERAAENVHVVPEGVPPLAYDIIAAEPSSESTLYLPRRAGRPR